MAKDKPRLYVGLYARGASAAPNTYHWALLTGTKDDAQDPRGAQFHVKNILRDGVEVWSYEEIDLAAVRAPRLLVRVRLAKVADMAALRRVLGAVHVPTGPAADVPDWRCTTWVRDALRALIDEGVLGSKGNLSWDNVRAEAERYVTAKKSEGRFDVGNDDGIACPTYDLIEGRETTP